MAGRRKRTLLPACLFYVAVISTFTLASWIMQASKPSHEELHRSVGRHLLEVTVANCTPRSLDEFPNDFMTEKERRAGGVVAHVLIALYIFAALAIVCDDYFVASLEVLCQVFKMRPDVAGATFMAAGSSAPELFTSIIGVFFSKSDIGIGTIVGSAVFNILFVVAICGLFSGMVIPLTWWPLFRDCIFYAISIVALICIISDEHIHWYEATVMLVLYIFYIIMMYFNENLSRYFDQTFGKWVVSETAKSSGSGEKSLLLKDSYESPHYESIGGSESPDEVQYETPLKWPDTWCKRLFWLLMLPITLLFFITIPDCRRAGCWRHAFSVTFFLSVVWIGALSYVLVWMITIIGDTLDVPDTVMGLTVLAAGTSVPDAMAGFIVARAGEGDMALSNSIGSNNFDILVGLGLPWFLKTAISAPNSLVTINSAGLIFSSISLLGTVIFLLVAVCLNRSTLDRRLGFICLIVYFIFVTFACLYELNILAN